eukprot:447530_1
MQSLSITTTLMMILLLVGLLLGIYIIILFIRNLHLKSQSMHVYFRISICSAISLYFVIMLSLLSMIIISGDKFSEKINILNFVSLIAYFGLLVTASCTFMGQLHFSSKNTQYKLGKTILLTLWIMVFIIIILYTSIVVTKLFCELLNNTKNICAKIPMISSVILLLYVILSLILVILFSKKLRQIITNYQIYIENPDLSRKHKQTNSKQRVETILMKKMTRHLLLASLQFSSTLFIAIWIQFYSYYYQVLCVIIDSIINLLCIIFQYKFATHMYEKYCSICNQCCMHLVTTRAHDEQQTNTDNIIPLKMTSNQLNESSDHDRLQSKDSTFQNVNMSISITSTNISTKIHKTDFPAFELDYKYLKQCKFIYVTLIKLQLIISIENIAQIISEYTATIYKSCVECGDQHAFIECYNDYVIMNNVLVNCDCNDEIRYYLMCAPSLSTNIENNINHYDEAPPDILCVNCASKSICSMCDTQYFTYLCESSLLADGCDLCKSVICEDCALFYKDQILCLNCCPESISKTDKDHKVVSYKSYKSLNSKSSNNNLSKWGNFQF